MDQISTSRCDGQQRPHTQAFRRVHTADPVLWPVGSQQTRGRQRLDQECMSHTSATTTATHLGRLEVKGHGEQTPDAPGDGNWISRQQRPHSHVREAGRGHQSHRLATLSCHCHCRTPVRCGAGLSWRQRSAPRHDTRAGLRSPAAPCVSPTDAGPRLGPSDAGGRAKAAGAAWGPELGAGLLPDPQRDLSVV